MGSGAFGLVWPITKYIKLWIFINTLTHDITSSPNMKNLILNYFEIFSLINSLITRRNQRIFIFSLALKYLHSKSNQQSMHLMISLLHCNEGFDDVISEKRI